MEEVRGLFVRGQEMTVQYDPTDIQNTGLKDLERSSFTKDTNGNTAQRVMVMNNCIVISFSPRGEFDIDVSYVAGDVVSYNGSSYAAIQSTTGNLPTDEDFFMVISEKSTTPGPQGEDGPQGEQGPQGEPATNIDFGTVNEIDLYTIVYDYGTVMEFP